MRRSLLSVLAMLSLTVAALPRNEKPSPALASLVESERAFARKSVETSAREAFFEFFADDGIGFQPGPVKTRAVILSRPAPAQRPPVTLNWFPVHGDIAGAGDLGYTTGPYVRTDNSPQKSPPDYGYYFSVWRKQADGAWKVALDLGVPVPALDLSAPHATEFHAAKQTGWKQGHVKLDLAAARAELLAAEREFSAASLSDGAGRAFATRDLDDARFHHSGALPFVGTQAISGYLSENVAKFSWEVIDAGAAQSGDFGYTYGSYELVPAAGKGDGKTEKGYFARVWKRDAKGRWRAAMSVAHAVPPA
ncbi:MAG: YybH family protein [Pyrinomonadaceae bacterium]